jgi:NitT/TauT family transport system permease protein
MAVAVAARRSAALLAWLRNRGGALAIFVLLFLLWEFAVRLTDVKEYLLPPPSKVRTEFWRRHELVSAGAWVTTKEILAGYALAVVVSIPLALTVAYSRFMEQAVYPVIVFLQIIPKIAIAPLFIIWFGFGFMPKLLLVFLLSFFPIVVSSIAGFKSADRDVMDFARTTGAGGMRMFLKIRLPQALPHFFTGLKVGAALAATAAVVA